MLNKILKNIFLAINKEKIRYVVLRNYLKTEDLNVAKDIDILVHPDDTEKLNKILLKDGWLPRLIPREEWGHIDMFQFDKQSKKVYVLDIQNNLFFGKNKLKIGSMDKILKKRKLLYECIYIPNDIHGLVIFIFRLALEKNTITEEQLAQVKTLYEYNKVNKFFLNTIKDDFGVITYELLNKIIINDACLLNIQYYKEIAQLSERSFPRCRINKVLMLWQKIKIKVARCIIIIKPVKLVAFIGVDGSGKSTLIGKLKEFSPIFKSQLYLGWNNYFFKRIGKLNRRIDFSNKKLQSLANRILFFLFHLLLPFDFFIRYLRAKSQAKYGIIISDRYPLPKKKSGIYRKLSLSLTYFLLPRPSILFILDADPGKIWKRKKEGNYEKFKAEFERLEKAKNIFKDKTIIVNTDCSVEKSFNNIKKELSQYVSKLR